MARNKRLLLLLTVLISLGSSANLLFADESGGAGINETCPVTEGEPVDEAIYAEFEGRTVYFCCQRCRRMFLKDPGSYTARLASIPSKGHDHESDHGNAAQAPLATKDRTLRFAGKFHPVVVHFPIAMLMFSCLFAGLSLATKRRDYLIVSRYLILWGAPVTVLAALLGWSAWSQATYSGELLKTLEFHRWLGTTAAILSLVALVLSERHWRSPTLIRQKIAFISLAIVAGLVGVAGHFGGMLIFGMEYYKW
ncbi:MAG: hypothetical protein HKN21_09855 [Candidatus Eisenbacteria bacterium]|uniref:DUF2231 domain-containing protein n=1 Tax=Eiseniibacteriota bacterium TaxID=2212470 RepID=A0A7Y2E8A5_UNCEI|nr:hypothetical protein [Candidatus Eisenbacteria bacterium]